MFSPLWAVVADPSGVPPPPLVAHFNRVSTIIEQLAAWCPLVLGAPLVYVLVLLVARDVQMWWWRGSLSAFELRLPRGASAEQVARWAGSLCSILRARRWWSPFPRWPLVLETTATGDGLRRVLLVPQRLQADVLATLSAVLPGARLIADPDYLTAAHPVRWRTAAEARLWGAAELLDDQRAEDTSRHLLAAMQPLHAGEVIRVQWLLAGALSPAASLPRRSRRAVSRDWGERLATADPMLLACCRVAVASPVGYRRARAILSRVWAALRGMNTPWTKILRRVMPGALVSWRLRMLIVPLRHWPLLVTSKEAAGLLGLASGVEGLPGLPRLVSRSLPPPAGMPGSGLVLARSNYPGVDRLLSLSTVDRLRHVWMLGPTGAGKSTLLANMIGQDILEGHGLVLVDARGDLVPDVLDRMPQCRREDVIVMDPTRIDHVVGLNPLRAAAGGDGEQAASLVYHVLHSIFADSWGPRTADILRAALLTLASTTAADGQPFTLIDVPELLTSPGFRRLVLAQQVPGQVRSFWSWYDSLNAGAQLNAISPVLNKLRAFTLSTRLRLMLGHSFSVTMPEIVAQNRILLVPLKKGLLGVESAALVGSLVIAAVWQAALARANTPAAQRAPFWLYVDEFQDVVRLPLDLADMLAQARGLGLGMVLAHQYLAQLTPDVKAAVLATARTQILFQLGMDDAADLAPAFAPLSADDLRSLSAYEITVRACVDGATQPAATGVTLPLPPAVGDAIVLADESRARYGLPAALIVDQANARTTIPAPAGRANRIILEPEP